MGPARRHIVAELHDENPVTTGWACSSYAVEPDHIRGRGVGLCENQRDFHEIARGSLFAEVHGKADHETTQSNHTLARDSHCQGRPRRIASIGEVAGRRRVRCRDERGVVSGAQGASYDARQPRGHGDDTGRSRRAKRADRRQQEHACGRARPARGSQGRVCTGRPSHGQAPKRDRAKGGAGAVADALEVVDSGWVDSGPDAARRMRGSNDPRLHVRMDPQPQVVRPADLLNPSNPSSFFPCPTSRARRVRRYVGAESASRPRRGPGRL